MIIRARAPLRLGLAGGGTDVSPYCDVYGGWCSMPRSTSYAYTVIEPPGDGTRYAFRRHRPQQSWRSETAAACPLNGETLDLHKGVYNRIVTAYQRRRADAASR
jgi:D-glycero-alpha-D-manno-heptose-7-phosphate kinase